MVMKTNKSGLPRFNFTFLKDDSDICQMLFLTPKIQQHLGHFSHNS